LFKWFDRTNTRPATAGEIGADLVFLDPPYRFLTDRPNELLQLALHLTHSHLSPGATVIFRHDVKNQFPLPNLQKYDQREYGEMAIELLRFSNE
jgi:16S rRNA G966 N2-methylase RsmD